MEDNIFKNIFADDLFKLDIIEKVYLDWKNSRKNKDIVNRENAEDMLYEYFSQFDFAIDEFLDEEFEEDE